jgi:hypothetical protein
MAQKGIFNWSLAFIAALGICFPTTVFATAPTQSGVIDVALMDGDVLVGQLVNVQGSALASAPVTLQYQNKVVATPKTDKNGYFALKNVKPGVYKIGTKKGQMVYRLWSPNTAPPTAQKGALVVDGDQVARAQHVKKLTTMLANPWVVTAIVATAVAVPVAIHNSKDSTPVSP